MNCIIVDDELTARVIMSRLCERIEGVNVVKEFSSAIEALKFLNKNEIDLVFLDIHMPDFSGIEFLKALKNPPKIILTTADPKFAIQAFEYKCIIDYLLKPIEFSRFLKAVENAEVNTIKVDENRQPSFIESASKNDLYININRRLIKIDMPSIYLVEAKGDYINIKTKNKNYVVHSTLKKIEQKLPESLFLKVHRSYIINTDRIIDIEDNSVLIKSDLIPISRSKRQELMKRLNLL